MEQVRGLTNRALVMTEETAADALGLSARTLQRWRVEGRGPSFVKFGKRVGYTEDALRRYVEASERTSTSQAAG
jgi:predicted site-specific integrase-resolvase